MKTKLLLGPVFVLAMMSCQVYSIYEGQTDDGYTAPSVNKQFTTIYGAYGYCCFGYDLLAKDFNGIVYKTDLEVYGQEEYWATPEECWKNHAGDCEDQCALFGYIAKKQFGVEPVFAVVEPSDRSESHMVVLLPVFSGDRRWNSNSEMDKWDITHRFTYGEWMWIAENTHGHIRFNAVSEGGRAIE